MNIVIAYIQTFINGTDFDFKSWCTIKYKLD